MIYFNGDSHTCGIGLDSSQRFSDLVARHFDHPLVNDAKIGASNSRIIRTTKQYLKTNTPDLVIIGWSSWEREEWEYLGQYYDVNSSGHDVLPKELELQYKSWVLEQNEDSLKIKSDYWHNQIYNFHCELLENKQPHLFFNCMYNFFDANIQDWHRVKFRDIEDADENTQIVEMVMLKFSYLKSFVLAPILGACTGLIFLLCLYWYESLQARFLYSEVNDLKRATHIRVTGKSMFNFDINYII
jgi:hypothetical protein